MKEFRAKVMANGIIENYFFKEADKQAIWDEIQSSHQGLKKEIEVFRRHSPESKDYGGRLMVIYKEEIIYSNKEEV